MTKRTLLFIIVILTVLASVGVAAYLFWPHSSATVVPSTGASLPVAGQGSSGGTSGSTGFPVSGAAASSTQVTARLVEISAGPVVPGESVTDLKRTGTTSPAVQVSYIDRQSGNVFMYNGGTGTATRVNNKTIPGIESAQWSPDGSTAFVRYLSGSDLTTINTYALSATSSSTKGFFLPQDLSGIAVSARGVLAVASGENGSSASVVPLVGGTGPTVFTTPLSQIRASFVGPHEYLVFSKPAGALSGDAYLVSQSGHFSRIAGALNGLAALASPSGQWVLITYTQSNALRSMLVNTDTLASIPLPVGTIADKCVWSNNSAYLYCGIPTNPDSASTYPDDWYQGAVHFSDQVWRIDVAGRFAQMILDFSSADAGPLDAAGLAVDRADSALVFINKNDGSLWMYSLR